MFFFSTHRLNFTCRSFNFQSARRNIPGCRVGKDQLRVAVTHWLTSHNKQSRKRQQCQGYNQNASSSLLTHPLAPTPPFPPSSLHPPLLPHTFLPRPPFFSLWPFWQRCRRCHADRILSHSVNDCGMVGGGVGGAESGGGGVNLHRHQQTPPSPIIMA